MKQALLAFFTGDTDHNWPIVIGAGLALLWIIILFFPMGTWLMVVVAALVAMLLVIVPAVFRWTDNHPGHWF